MANDVNNSDNRSIMLSHIMTPEMGNFAGNIHGGHILHLLDQAAYACAVNYSGFYAVTLSVDHVLFKQAIHVGEQVTFLANTNYVGNSSMEIGIRVEAKNLKTQEKRHAMTCYFTMIAMDENMQPVPVRPLALNTELEKRRFYEAKMRRKLSRENQENHQKLKSGELHSGDC